MQGWAQTYMTPHSINWGDTSTTENLKMSADTPKKTACSHQQSPGFRLSTLTPQALPMDPGTDWSSYGSYRLKALTTCSPSCKCWGSHEASLSSGVHWSHHPQRWFYHKRYRSIMRRQLKAQQGRLGESQTEPEYSPSQQGLGASPSQGPLCVSTKSSSQLLPKFQPKQFHILFFFQKKILQNTKLKIIANKQKTNKTKKNAKTKPSEIKGPQNP